MIMNKSRKQYLRIKKPKKKMPKLAKGLLFSVMKKFMAEILDSLVGASEPSDGVIRVITGNNLPVAK